MYAIYTRSHPAQAFKLERFTQFKESAQLDADVNKGFGVETRIVPTYAGKPMPEWAEIDAE